MTTTTTCNICLDDKEDKDMVRKLPSSDCKCTFRQCIDCALKCDFGLCRDLSCANAHAKCPQCRQQLKWPACVSQRVLSDATRMAYLFNKSREQYQDVWEKYDRRLIDIDVLFKKGSEMASECDNLRHLNKKLLERLRYIEDQEDEFMQDVYYHKFRVIEMQIDDPDGFVYESSYDHKNKCGEFLYETEDRGKEKITMTTEEMDAYFKEVIDKDKSTSFINRLRGEI